MERQIRLWLTVTPEEDEEIMKAYARYLLDSDEHKSRSQWIKDNLLNSIRSE